MAELNLNLPALTANLTLRPRTAGDSTSIGNYNISLFGREPNLPTYDVKPFANISPAVMPKQVEVNWLLVGGIAIAALVLVKFMMKK